MLEDVSSGLGWEYVVYNKLAVTGEEIPVLNNLKLNITNYFIQTFSCEVLQSFGGHQYLHLHPQ